MLFSNILPLYYLLSLLLLCLMSFVLFRIFRVHFAKVETNCELLFVSECQSRRFRLGGTPFCRVQMFLVQRPTVARHHSCFTYFTTDCKHQGTFTCSSTEFNNQRTALTRRIYLLESIVHWYIRVLLPKLLFILYRPSIEFRSANV